MMIKNESWLRARAPERLVTALEQEARRRMTNKSALIRWAVAKEIGLLNINQEHKPINKLNQGEKL